MSTDEPERDPQLPKAPEVSNGELANAPQSTGRHLLIGLVIGVVVYLIALAITATSGRDTGGYWALNLLGFMAVITFVLLITGLVLVSRPSSRMFGAGLLISVAAGLVIDSGACIALLRTA